jgi:phosphatidate cytidylyltransferase
MALPGRFTEQAVGILFGISLSLWVVYSHSSGPELGLSLLLIAVFSTYLSLGGGLDERLVRLAWTLLGIMYLGYLMPQWVLLFRLAEGRAWVFFVLLVVMTGDTTAYFTGRTLGKRKLAPQISPGKTLEGAAGYVLGSMVAGLVGARMLVSDLGWFEALALSAVLSILGQLGDLFESWIKRVFAVKDSSDLLPGHGGLLDRLDSLIFPMVFTTHYLRIFHL